MDKNIKGGEEVSFVKKAVPPPDVEEGNVLKTRVIDVKKVTSQWKDDEGNPKEQLQFDLLLEDTGYKLRSWIAFYETPSDKSILGRLVLKLQETTNKQYGNVNEFLTALKEFGYVFVKCKGFREYEEEVYPNFSIVADKLPAFQEKLEKTEKADKAPEPKQFDPKEILTRFKEAISYDLPLNENDWNKNLLVEERLYLLRHGLIEHKEDLYFFTDKATSLFR